MPLSASGRAIAPTKPLAGRRAWLITDDKIGMQVQVKGVAAALGVAAEQKVVAPKGIWRTFAPFGPPSPAERIGHPGSQFAPPWPDIALATGRLSIPYLRAIGRKAGPTMFTVVLQDPRTSARTADLIWVPEHDKRRGANVITTLTSAHGFSPERIAALKATWPAWLDNLPHPRVALVLGGPSSVYRFTAEDDARLAAALGSIAALGASFLITPSRRTHDSLRNAVLAATANASRFVWDGTGENPYGLFLAHADAFVVTGDSVNMTGEPLVTGKPVWVFEPSGGSAKFARFHASLRRYGATRSLPHEVTNLETWSYVPIDAAAIIAREIEQRWLRRQAMLNGGGKRGTAT